jgi:hypothetical protein
MMQKPDNNTPKGRESCREPEKFYLSLLYRGRGTLTIICIAGTVTCSIAAKRD